MPLPVPTERTMPKTAALSASGRSGHAPRISASSGWPRKLCECICESVGPGTLMNTAFARRFEPCIAHHSSLSDIAGHSLTGSAKSRSNPVFMRVPAK